MEGQEPVSSVSRRAVLAGLAATVVPTAATPTVTTEAIPTLYERVDTTVRELLALMQELHGGMWTADVQHELKMIFLLQHDDRPKPPCPPSVERLCDSFGGYTLKA
jgi:hypothetical protein